jgi:hypothetical protein
MMSLHPSDTKALTASVIAETKFFWHILRYILLAVPCSFMNPTWIRGFSVGSELNEKNAKGPDVGLDGILLETNRFWSHRAKRQQRLYEIKRAFHNDKWQQVSSVQISF